MVVDKAVVVEFTRDGINDQGDNELGDHLLATVIHLKFMNAYLDDYANQNESLVFTLFADILPPYFEAKSPIVGTTKAFALWKYRLEQLILGDQRSLRATNNEQLLVVSLVQADADGQVQAHAPVFHLAREGTVHGIDDEDGEGEDVHYEQGQEHERDIPHSEDGMPAV